MSKGLKELYSPDIIRFLDDGRVEYLYTEKQVNTITSELQALDIIKEYFYFSDDPDDKVLCLKKPMEKEKIDFLKEVLKGE